MPRDHVKWVAIGSTATVVQVISFINMKGGVGKITLAVNVAYCLAWVHAKRVLVIDADPQFNATQYLLDDDAYLEHIQDSKKGTLRDIFVPRRLGPVNTVSGSARATNKARIALSDCSCAIFNGSGTNRGKLDLIPSTLALMDIETSKRGTEAKLMAYIKEKAQGYDYVIIDCPPTISIFTQSAILASTRYVVPIKPDPLSVIGLPLLERWLEDYTSDFGIQLESVGLVFTMVRGPLPTRMRELMAELRSQRANEVFAAHLSNSTDVAESVEVHRPVFLHKPNCKTALQISEITKEFISRTK